ncbi:MAG: class I SAM-dependent methyltransferase [Pseudomonadales bacterium]
MGFTTNKAVLSETIQLQGCRALDVGSGDGLMVRYMATHGAIATGIECSDTQLRAAHAAQIVANEEYVAGVGQDLPFEAASFDLVTFFSSLHHVPKHSMQAALSEAARTLHAGGELYIAEPIASGSGFELHAPVDDETEVRAFAIESLSSIEGFGLQQTLELFYDTVYQYRDFAAFEEELIRIDASRQSAFDSLRSELETRFYALGAEVEAEADTDTEVGQFAAQSWSFEQPMRLNLYRKL